ncbi:MAG: ribosome maturation factor RimM [Acidimicrobiia bacterium]
MKKRASLPASNSSTDHEPFAVARLGRPHGLSGFMGLYVDEANLVHFDIGSVVQVGEDKLTVRDVRRADRGFQISFVEITDREAADRLRGLDVLVDERRHLDDDEFWPEDLIGMKVFDEDGSELGRVDDVVFGAAQDRLVVSTPKGRFEVPFVDELVPVVDLGGRKVELSTIPGLIEPRD